MYKHRFACDNRLPIINLLKNVKILNYDRFNNIIYIISTKTNITYKIDLVDNMITDCHNNYKFMYHNKYYDFIKEYEIKNKK